MSGPRMHGVPGHGETSPHIQRLVQRSVSPGVIDVKSVQRQYARTAGWIRQRFSLIDRLRSRYGCSDTPGPENGNLVFSGVERRGDAPLVSSAPYVCPSSSPGVDATIPAAIAAKTESEGNIFSLKQDASAAKDRISSLNNAGEQPPIQPDASRGDIPGAIQRLVQRSVSPGVIDVKPVQRQYARTAGRLAQRFGLIDRLQSRQTHGNDVSSQKNASAAFGRGGPLLEAVPVVPPGSYPGHSLSADPDTTASAMVTLKSNIAAGITSTGNRDGGMRYELSKRDAVAARRSRHCQGAGTTPMERYKSISEHRTDSE
jgi:hypothetical protein